MKCPACRLDNPENALKCDCGFEFSTGSMGTASIVKKEIPTSPSSGWKPWQTYLSAAVVLLIVMGFTRIYYGGGMGFQVVAKHSFSYTDNIVNLDDIIGQPRIAVAMAHPAVKRQLEEMGVLESDQQVMDRAQKEMQKTMEKAQEEIKAGMEKAQADFQASYEESMRKINQQFGN